MTQNITYSVDKAAAADILRHLEHCNTQFIPHLDQKVNLKEYAEKIRDKAVTFEAWDGETLAAVIAAYFSSEGPGRGFITNVSTMKEFSGRGLGSTLMEMCIDHMMKNEFEDLDLEVSALNQPALALYKKFGFNVISTSGDSIFMKKKLQIS